MANTAGQLRSDPAAEKFPLCVDLDGTLIKTEMLGESALALIKKSPLYIIYIPFWLLRGRAHLKRQIANRVEIDPSLLPYNQQLLAYLTLEYESGRSLVLATASDEKIARSVADYLGIFDSVFGSDGERNLLGRTKGEVLSEEFGEQGFDYAGDSSADLEVWPHAHQAVLVNTSRRVSRKLIETGKVVEQFHEKEAVFRQFVDAARVRQWVKNLLVLVPILASHHIVGSGYLLQGLLAIASFSLCASSVYLMNDLLDLESDRLHPTKRQRPFASGALSIRYGLILTPALIAASFGLAAFLPLHFTYVLGGYLALTMAYSLAIKRLALLDVVCLAALYTLRIIAGHEATHIRYSFWLLALSMFLFLSLALVKRTSELGAAKRKSTETARGRGYYTGDLAQLSSLGTASGYIAVLVLALYINSSDVMLLYKRPQFLWLVCPMMLYWISRVWLITARGQMDEDPIVFAIKDPVSYYLGFLVLIAAFLATRA